MGGRSVPGEAPQPAEQHPGIPGEEEEGLRRPLDQQARGYTAGSVGSVVWLGWGVRGDPTCAGVLGPVGKAGEFLLGFAWEDKSLCSCATMERLVGGELGALTP